MSLVAYLRPSAAYFVLALLLGASVSITGCNVFKTTCGENDRTCLNGGLARGGDSCDRNGDCALGLDCNAGKCEYSHATPKGDKCVATEECGPDLYCSAKVKCEAISAKAQDVGGSCGTSADCKKGLACDADVSTLFTKGPFGELSPDCQMSLMSAGDPAESCQLPKQCVKRGSKDTGAACKTSSECLAGLYCYDLPNPLDGTTSKVCVGSPMALDQEPISIPSWDGTTCPKDDSDAIAYFDVPRDGKALKDFYRLPFPNDLRKTNGKVDLTDHPVAPSSTGVPVIERFVKAASNVLDGFSTNPVIYFRFSKEFDASSQSLSGASVHIVDISKGSPTYDSLASIEWSPSRLHSKYICDNWLGLRRPVGQPLRGGTTYAAIVTRQVKTSTGLAFKRSPDLDALLGSNAPGDAALSAAYAAYAPLRAWLASSNAATIKADDVLTATVFTTQDPEDVLPALHAAVAKDGAAKLKDMVVCKAGVKSPCEDGTRGQCHAENSTYTEIHGHIALPIFQKGTPPYEVPEQGGAIARDANGAAMVQSHMDVCFAMSIPKKAAPAKGFPVVLYAHGTGGSFAGQMDPGGLAQDVATGPTPGILFAIDMPEHGNRRGDSKRPPEDLFFNFLNPEGARGNVLQGSADMLGLALLVRSGAISAADSPTGSAITFDASRVMFFGHSQGATHSAIALPYEGGVQGGVLSGVGGHLATSLLSKKKPVDIGAILPFVLFDADMNQKLVGGTYNPALSIIQMFFDSADPINYAAHYKLNATMEAPTGHDLFMTYGLGDSYAPEKTQEAYARAADLTLVEPNLTGIKLESAAAPLTENVTLGTSMRVVGMRQYDPMGLVDGHFVATETTQGRKDVVGFVHDILNGVSPTIGQ